MRLRRPITSTAVASVPATTCALVITSSGAKTKPDPSSCRWHDGALPRIFRTLGCAAATAGLLGSAEFGGPVAVTGVRAKGLSTSGKPELSSSWRSSAGSCLAAVGMTESTALSTCDPRTPDAMAGRLAVASGSATSQAATTTASACRTEPSVESTARKRSPVMRSRTRRPRNTPVVSPSTTSITTTATLTITRVFVLLMPSASSGATRTPMIAPPSTPTNDSSATAMPCRHPEMAASSASAMTMRSTQLMAPRSPDGPPGRCATPLPGRGPWSCPRGAPSHRDPTARTICPP